ncbi:MAG TPA: hypothetical protein VKM72_10140 [Thermoanaerobaculia bacterium]|nr:hypothetical protein [Thermoanaerobaculia bacterium]
MRGATRSRVLWSIVALSVSIPLRAAPGTGVLLGTDGANLLSIAPATGAGSVIGPLSGGAAIEYPALAVHPATGTVYAGGGADLYTVNPGTGALTRVGDTGLGVAGIEDLDFSANGTLYAAVSLAGAAGSGADHLALLNRMTGTATIIGPFGTCSGVSIPGTGAGSCSLEGMDALAFDAAGALWGALRAGGAGTPGLYRINPATGKAVFRTAFTNDAGVAASGGMASLHFACDGVLLAGTAIRIGSGTDGGELRRVDPFTGLVQAGGGASGATALEALAYRQPCVSQGAVTLPIRFSAADSLGALELTGSAVFDTDPVTGGSPYGPGRVVLAGSGLPDGGLEVRVFDFESLHVAPGARLQARGDWPLILTSSGDLVVDGVIDVSGVAGLPGLKGAGGGGGGAVALFAEGKVRVGPAGQILAQGGDGGLSVAAARRRIVQRDNENDIGRGGKGGDAKPGAGGGGGGGGGGAIEHPPGAPGSGGAKAAMSGEKGHEGVCGKTSVEGGRGGNGGNENGQGQGGRGGRKDHKDGDTARLDTLANVGGGGGGGGATGFPGTLRGGNGGQGAGGGAGSGGGGGGGGGDGCDDGGGGQGGDGGSAGSGGMGGTTGHAGRPGAKVPQRARAAVPALGGSGGAGGGGIAVLGSAVGTVDLRGLVALRGGEADGSLAGTEGGTGGLSVYGRLSGGGAVDGTVALSSGSSLAGWLIAGGGDGGEGAGPGLSLQVPPICRLVSSVAGPPAKITVRTEDDQSGLGSIKVLESTNAAVSIPPFPVGTTDPVLVTGTKIDQALKSVVRLQVFDVAGNSVTCDPVITLVVRERGKPVVETISGIPQEEHWVRVINGTPGITNLLLTVNGVRFRLASLADGAEQTLDISQALRPGNTNEATLTASGRPGGSATIVIHD